MNMKRFFTAAAVVMVAALPIFADKPARAYRSNELRPDQPFKGELDLGYGQRSVESFVFRVPEDAFAVRVRLVCTEADLDLFVNPGRMPADYRDVLAYSAGDEFNETVFISRMSENPLETGSYSVDIAYRLDRQPVRNGVPVTRINYELDFEIIKAEPSKRLRQGTAEKLTLDPENGMFAVFSAEIPSSVGSFRIDITETNADLDLFIKRGRPAMNRDDADHISESLLGRESIIVKNSPAGRPGPVSYYISVTDQVVSDLPQVFTILLTYGEEPDASLLGIPVFETAYDGFDSAVQATVEVIAENGKGSGCLVAENGWILTNWHVVESPSGLPSEKIGIASTVSQTLPPREMFRAEVVEYDKKLDLALLRITGGLYGQPLPSDYRFPYMNIGDPSRLRLGQPIAVLGYPSVGGSGSRSSITMTTGVVSGFDRTAAGTLIKTDCLINSGNSGGAAIDAYHELLGFPTFTVDDMGEHMGYILPVTLVPAAWLELISAR